MGDNKAETGEGGHTNGGYFKKKGFGLAHINPQF